MDLANRVQGAPPRSVGVLLRRQVGLEDRPQDRARRHLLYARLDRGDAHRTLFAIRFGEVAPPHRLGTIRSLAEFIRQFAQPSLFAVRLDVRERLTIDAGRAAIALAAGE